MRAKWVVCMGAPKRGLLNATVTGIGAGWNLSVADIGISGMAWRKYGTRRHGVEFCADWVVQLNFHSGGVA
jgi:enhancer of mRNA-decapping protein 3